MNKVAKRMTHTPEGNVYTIGAEDAMIVKKLVETIRELKKEVKFWKKLSRRAI